MSGNDAPTVDGAVFWVLTGNADIGVSKSGFTADKVAGTPVTAGAEFTALGSNPGTGFIAKPVLVRLGVTGVKLKADASGIVDDGTLTNEFGVVVS